MNLDQKIEDMVAFILDIDKHLKTVSSPRYYYTIIAEFNKHHDIARPEDKDKVLLGAFKHHLISGNVEAYKSLNTMIMVCVWVTAYHEAWYDFFMKYIPENDKALFALCWERA